MVSTRPTSVVSTNAVTATARLRGPRHGAPEGAPPGRGVARHRSTPGAPPDSHVAEVPSRMPIIEAPASIELHVGLVPFLHRQEAHFARRARAVGGEVDGDISA